MNIEEFKEIKEKLSISRSPDIKPALITFRIGFDEDEEPIIRETIEISHSLIAHLSVGDSVQWGDKWLGNVVDRTIDLKTDSLHVEVETYRP